GRRKRAHRRTSAGAPRPPWVTREGAVDGVDDEGGAEAQEHGAPLRVGRINQRGERERRPGGGEDMHGKGACLDERGQFGLHFACTYRPDSSEARVTISRFEVVVVGGGPAGLTAAIALAGAGIATALGPKA